MFITMMIIRKSTWFVFGSIVVWQTFLTFFRKQFSVRRSGCKRWKENSVEKGLNETYVEYNQTLINIIVNLPSRQHSNSRMCICVGVVFYQFSVCRCVKFTFRYNSTVYLCLRLHDEDAVHGVVIEEHVLQANIKPQCAHCKW